MTTSGPPYGAGRKGLKAMSMTTEQLSALLETPAAFRAWLEAKEPGTWLGDGYSWTDGPLARFIKSHLPYDAWASIGHLRASVKGGGVLYFIGGQNPEYSWVVEFAKIAARIGIERSHNPITAAECLRILDGIEGEAT